MSQILLLNIETFLMEFQFKLIFLRTVPTKRKMGVTHFLEIVKQQLL